MVKVVAMSLWFISPQGRRVFGLIFSGLKQGLSGRKILDVLRTYGLGYRTQTFYADLREIRDWFETWQKLRAYRWDVPLPVEAHAPGVVRVPGKNFLYRLRIVELDEETGQFETRVLSVVRERAMSIYELRDVVRGWGKKYNKRFIDFVPEQTFRRVR